MIPSISDGFCFPVPLVPMCDLLGAEIEVSEVTEFSKNKLAITMRR